jgi:glycogen debranching enzyme
VAALLKRPSAAGRYAELASRLEARINRRFWLPGEGSYADFYGTRAQAVSAAEGAVKQIGLKGTNNLTSRDRELMSYYRDLGRKFATMPDTSRGWITNRNWVITTPMEMGIAPRARALEALDRIRRQNVGEYGPFLSATDRGAMMTISTGVQAVSEAKYGRTAQALWYMDRIVETFNRVLPGSISEMMPDYGCFAISWTSYGIVIPLVEHVFGIEPDVPGKTIVFHPHVPAGWKDMRIENLPVGANTISFSRTVTGRGVEYAIEAEQGGWTFTLDGVTSPGARYFVNGKPAAPTDSGFPLSGRSNHLLVVR